MITYSPQERRNPGRTISFLSIFNFPKGVCFHSCMLGLCPYHSFTFNTLPYPYCSLEYWPM